MGKKGSARNWALALWPGSEPGLLMFCFFTS